MNSSNLRACLLLAAVAGICVVVRLLMLVLQREWVKADLVRRGITPISVRWRHLRPAGVPNLAPASG